VRPTGTATDRVETSASTSLPGPGDNSAEVVELARSLDHAQYVVRGRVRETSKDVDGEAENPDFFATVDTFEYLKGDPSQVVESYRRGFPLLTPPGTSGHDAHDPSERELDGKAGVELIFLVDLPLVGRNSWREWPDDSSRASIPQRIRQAYGIHRVKFHGFLPLERREVVAAALAYSARRLEERLADARDATPADTLTEYARATVDRNSLPDEASLERVAEKVKSLIAAELKEKLGVDADFGPPTSRPEDPDRIRVSFPFVSATSPLQKGTLHVLLRNSNGIVTSFWLEWPGLRKFLRPSKRGALRFDRAAVLDKVNQRMGVRLGKGSEEVHVAARKDGLRFINVRFMSRDAGNLRMELTADRFAIFRYENEWQ